MSEEITVGQLIEALQHLDPKATVISAHAMGDGFEDVVGVSPPFEVTRRGDVELEKEYRAGKSLSRYRSVDRDHETPVVKCCSIQIGSG